MSRFSLVIGRFQPLHQGHISVIQKVLDEEKSVCVALMDTPLDKKNPYTVDERKKMIHEAFNSSVRIIVIPPIDEVCYGRNVGYHTRAIYLDDECHSATAIRDGTNVLPYKPDKDFLQSYNRVAKGVHEISASQGFWRDGKNRNVAEVIAHAHSELSEAFECLRLKKEQDKNIVDYSGVEVQLADVLGILMDMEIGYGLKISEALLKKMEYNKTRGYLHGKKF